MRIKITLTSLLALVLSLSTNAQELIEINCDSTKGNFNHLHGFLHGEISLENYPQAIQLVEDANFRFWRNNNAFDNQILADSLNFETTIVISDIYADNQGGYQNAKPWLNFSQFENYLINLYSSAITNNIAPDFWDVWNEPQSTEFWTGDFSQLIQTYVSARTAADIIDTNLQLVGPSIVSYDQLFISTFLDSLVANGITLNAVSWHEFSIPDSLSLHVEQFKALLQNNPQWGNPEIHVNEYSPRQTNQIPGWKAGWFYHLEKSNIDWANNACWDDMDDGVTQWNNCNRGLNGILSYNEQTPLPVFWTHKAYGSMVGQRLYSTGSDTKTIALASLESQSLKILTGRYYAIKTGEFLFPEDSLKAIENVTLKILNHPFPISSSQVLTVERIPKGDTISMHSPLLSPILISNSLIVITSDTIIINLPQYNDGDSYYISINSDLLANIEDIQYEKNSPKIYPNPVDDMLNIEYPYPSDWVLELFAMNGVRVANYVNASSQISLNGIKSGFYLLRFQDSKSQKYTLKLIKK